MRPNRAVAVSLMALMVLVWSSGAGCGGNGPGPTGGGSTMNGGGATGGGAVSAGGEANGGGRAGGMAAGGMVGLCQPDGGTPTWDAPSGACGCATDELFCSGRTLAMCRRQPTLPYALRWTYQNCIGTCVPGRASQSGAGCQGGGAAGGGIVGGGAAGGTAGGGGGGTAAGCDPTGGLVWTAPSDTCPCVDPRTQVYCNGLTQARCMQSIARPYDRRWVLTQCADRCIPGPDFQPGYGCQPGAGGGSAGGGSGGGMALLCPDGGVHCDCDRDGGPRWDSPTSFCACPGLNSVRCNQSTSAMALCQPGSAPAYELRWNISRCTGQCYPGDWPSDGGQPTLGCY